MRARIANPRYLSRDFFLYPSDRDSTNGLPQDISQDEIFASMFENMIRAEKGLPLRTHYVPDSEGSVLEESRLIKKSKAQNPFNTQYEPTEQAMKIWNNIINSRK